MQLGFVGLGKMGFNMVQRLVKKGHKIVGYNRSPEAVHKLISLCGIEGVLSYKDLVETLPEGKKCVWIMIPHTEVERAIEGILPFLHSGDVLIDGGNSFYKDSMRRHKELASIGIHFLDVGVSGGPDTVLLGGSYMVGGDIETFKSLESLFSDLSQQDGYGYMGVSGAGHFVKMIHNGIEYGMMQSIAEGFDVLKHSDYNINLLDALKVYSHGSVIASKLISYLQQAYSNYGSDLSNVSGTAHESGEGRWTIETARDMGIDVPAIASALHMRELSRAKPGYQGQIITALRAEFGNHPINEDNLSIK